MRRPSTRFLAHAVRRAIVDPMTAEIRASEGPDAHDAVVRGLYPRGARPIFHPARVSADFKGATRAALQALDEGGRRRAGS